MINFGRLLPVPVEAGRGPVRRLVMVPVVAVLRGALYRPVPVVAVLGTRTPAPGSCEPSQLHPHPRHGPS